jgi:hypothetical protein
LGQWVANQRNIQRRGKLPDERKERLEALPGWFWNPYEADWEEGHVRLRSFAQREGHTLMSKDYRDGDGFSLGAWVTRQRSRRDELSQERRRRLEAVPGWAWKAR